MTYVELIDAIREKTATPETWTQGEWARNAEGERCALDEGVCFCVEVSTPLRTTHER